jgi:hypothetical protein
VDLPALALSFDLGPFDGFLGPELYEQLEERASREAAAALEAEGPPAAGGGGEEWEGRLATSRRRRLAELVRAALGSGGGDGHALFAVTMLCLEPGWEPQAGCLLEAAFEAFPDKARRLEG